MMTKNLHALLFDLDGTLLDSFSAHYHAYEIMFPQFGIEVSEERFFKIYSPDWYHTYRLVGLPEEKWAAADAAWMDAARQIECKPFPDTLATLTQLAARYPLGLITSGSKSRVQRELRQTGLDAFFPVVVTGDDVERPKPDPQGLQRALAAMGIRAGTANGATAVYIGDTVVDYETAQAAGLLFVGMNGRFQTFPPDASFPRISHLSELLTLLA
jgi:HAD superfamily hydrolase (TIGR01549 family)